MSSKVRDPRKLFAQLTDSSQERNIYTHPNPFARDIFWNRLELLLRGMQRSCGDPREILDFGGGSGGFLKGLCQTYPHSQIDVVDLEPADAERVRSHHVLANAAIYRADLEQWDPKKFYDLIVATDVLEHFRDLEVPVRSIRRLLNPGGYLCISVPTENWLYLAGRILINKTKPADHFHAGKNILKHLQAHGFRVVWENLAPRYFGLSIPLFHLAVLKAE